MSQNRPLLDPNKDDFSTMEVAQVLGMAVRSVQLMVDREELKAWKTPGGHRRISRASIAVSYTHLDVYKRQLAQLSDRVCTPFTERNPAPSSVLTDMPSGSFSQTKRQLSLVSLCARAW